MMPNYLPLSASFRRGWPLAAVAVLIALATLLTGGPEPAQAQPTDTTAPTLKSVAVSRYEDTEGTRSTPPSRTNYSTLKLTFSEDLDPNSMPAGSAFRVVSRLAHIERNHVGTGVAIRGTSTNTDSIAGRTIKVRLEGVGNPDWIFGAASLTVTYTKPTLNPLQDVAGNDVANFNTSPPNRTGYVVECHWRTGNWYVTNMYGRAGEDSNIPCDMAKPTWRHSSQGNAIEWFYSDSIPAPPANLRVESVIYTVPGEPNHRAVRGSDDNCYREERVHGRWLRSVSYGSYASGSVSEGCRNASWNTYNRAVNHAMVNPDGGTFPSGAAPVAVMFDSATVIDNTLTLTFDQHLRSSSKPAPSAFTVTVNNARRSVAAGGVAVSGRNVTLTLTSAAAYGDTVTVRYTKPSANPLAGRQTRRRPQRTRQPHRRGDLPRPGGVQRHRGNRLDGHANGGTFPDEWKRLQGWGFNAMQQRSYGRLFHRGRHNLSGPDCRYRHNLRGRWHSGTGAGPSDTHELAVGRRRLGAACQRSSARRLGLEPYQQHDCALD